MHIEFKCHIKAIQLHNKERKNENIFEIEKVPLFAGLHGASIFNWKERHVCWLQQRKGYSPVAMYRRDMSLILMKWWSMVKFIV